MTTAGQTGGQAELVLPCVRLDEVLAFFVERVGFRLDAIAPAEQPTVACISGHGLSIRLVSAGVGAPARIRLVCDDPARLGGGVTELVAPDGTRVELVDAAAVPVIPALRASLEIARMREAKWSSGRAGMRYRDLVPGRQGGRFVASHIRVSDGGPVPDYVHSHDVRFQTIYCHRGWVRVVYEDQGPPFVMNAGDCVLQPPQIRHRVLECSPGAEVIELSCPAEHETRVDHAMSLPTAAVHADRRWAGQRFCRHLAAEASWHPLGDGSSVRDTGIGAATEGLAGVRVLRPGPAPATMHDGELLFLFVLSGRARLRAHARADERLEAGDAIVVPAGLAHALDGDSEDLEWLEVTLPARR